MVIQDETTRDGFVSRVMFIQFDELMTSQMFGSQVDGSEIDSYL